MPGPSCERRAAAPASGDELELQAALRNPKRGATAPPTIQLTVCLTQNTPDAQTELGMSPQLLDQALTLPCTQQPAGLAAPTSASSFHPFVLSPSWLSAPGEQKDLPRLLQVGTVTFQGWTWQVRRGLRVVGAAALAGAMLGSGSLAVLLMPLPQLLPHVSLGESKTGNGWFLKQIFC